MNTSDVLNRAADLIEERGWAKGEGWYQGDDSASLCLEGGIQAALGIRDEDYESDDEFRSCPAYKAVASYLGLSRRDQYVYDFNDNDGRTQAEVVEVLRASAVIEASREREAAEVSS